MLVRFCLQFGCLTLATMDLAFGYPHLTREQNNNSTRYSVHDQSRTPTNSKISSTASVTPKVNIASVLIVAIYFINATIIIANSIKHFFPLQSLTSLFEWKSIGEL